MACTIDFRRLDEGFGGKTYKRKRQESENGILTIDESENGILTIDEVEEREVAMDVDDESLPPTAKRSAVASSENPAKPTFGRPSYDGVIAGKVSGRKWKQPRKQRASAKQISLRKTTAEEREKEKLIKKAYKEKMNELKEEIRKNKVEKRKKAEERKKKKEENIMRSGTKFQVISNKNTLKKIVKSKDKKLLKVVSEEFVKHKSKK